MWQGGWNTEESSSGSDDTIDILQYDASIQFIFWILDYLSLELPSILFRYYSHYGHFILHCQMDGTQQSIRPSFDSRKLS